MSVIKNRAVRAYWENEPCGTGEAIVGKIPQSRRAFFEKVENHRYAIEPHIFTVAQFSRFHGRKVLEIGVGAGTDHLQWARSGVDLYGVDLTQAAISMTRARLKSHGFSSQLQRWDAEQRLPFRSGFFDVVYSWGVIHHAEEPEKILKEVYRILKPGGVFIGMLYGRHSLRALRLWIRRALLAGRPWQSLGKVVADHMESPGTHSYTSGELRGLLRPYRRVEFLPWITPYDTKGIPPVLQRLLPACLGWFLAFRAWK
jgi:ubiquinone/menaquinone biosynthesis C-methylase UbiE